VPLVFELSIQREFCAAHAIAMAGQREPMHGHNWKVTLAVKGPALDPDGLLCDFHLLERQLERVIGVLNNRTLNETPPFDQVNPTAEHVAKHIAEAMIAALPGNVLLSYCSVTEAPGCVATFRSS
jgi:6-pyruvoyltetrahydropterin/6-carboxytetrahydropterin synthase